MAFMTPFVLWKDLTSIIARALPNHETGGAGKMQRRVRQNNAAPCSPVCSLSGRNGLRLNPLGATFRAVIARLDADFSTMVACPFTIRRCGFCRDGTRSAAAVYRPIGGGAGGDHACSFTGAKTEKA
jgi:hypothetical protein